MQALVLGAFSALLLVACAATDETGSEDNGPNGGKADGVCAEAALDDNGMCRNPDGSFASASCCSEADGGAGATASAVEIKVNIHAGGEVVSHDGEPGWEADADEGGYRFETTARLTAADLPWTLDLGRGDVTLSEAGGVSIGYFAGDYDYSAGTDTTLPMRNGLPKGDIGDVFVTTVQSSESASGAFNVDAKVELELVP